MFKSIKMAAFVCLLAFNQFSLAANNEFPGRDIYRGVDYIELVDFRDQFDNVVVVDVRSKYEYETLKIKGAYNIALNSPRFIDNMRTLREENKDKKIVVYCNGKTCMKSYKAASKCKSQGVENVVAFDAGIMDWAKASPSHAELLGESPIDPAKLISKDRFKEHLVEPEAFSEMVQNNNVMVLDVRDRYQRSGMSLFIGAENQASLDQNEKLGKYVMRAKKEGKTLLIYDESGKQVRWLMYRLERAGVTDYKFMKGGTRAFFKHMKDRMKTAAR